MSREYDIKLLGEIPVNTKIREFGDSGTPIVISQPDSDISKLFKTISRELIKEINIRNITEAGRPNLEILL